MTTTQAASQKTLKNCSKNFKNVSFKHIYSKWDFTRI